MSRENESRRIFIEKTLIAGAAAALSGCAKATSVTGLDGPATQATNQYDVANYSSLDAAIAAIGSNRATLRFSTDQTLSADIVIPATLELMPVNGAIINHSSNSLTYAGTTARWPLAQVFNGTGPVVLTNSSEAYPEWWAANSVPGVTDMTAAIEAAMRAGPQVVLQATTYAISDTLAHITDDKLYPGGNPAIFNNGITIRGQGESKTTLKALPSFPGGSAAMINLDGNPNGVDVNTQPQAQMGNKLAGFTLDGSDIAGRGIRQRANVYFDFRNIAIWNIAGDMSDAAIYIAGVTTPGKDDADTTFGGTYEKITIMRSKGYGVFAGSNRTSKLTFRNCDIRFCAYGGMRISFAGLTLDGCTFASNGKSGATTGGFIAARAATTAVNRGLTILNCEFEANYWFEINIDWCFGFTVLGGVCAPYTHAGVSAQSVIKIGGTNADGGEISGFRVQAYTHPGYDIIGVDVLANGKNVEINSLSLDTTCFNTDAKKLRIDGSASSIRWNGYCVSATHVLPSFHAYAATHATSMTNVTGDGTEYTTNDFLSSASFTTSYNNGDHLNSVPADPGAGVFTAPYSGFYEFCVQWPCTGFAGTETDVEVAVIVNKDESPVRYLAYKQTVSSLTAGAINTYSGRVQIKLAAGDRVEGSIKISGGPKGVDIYRNIPAPGGFAWSGRAF